MVFLEGSGAGRRLSLVARQGLRRELDVDEFAGLISVFLDKRLVSCMESAAVLTKSYDTFLLKMNPDSH